MNYKTTNEYKRNLQNILMPILREREIERAERNRERVNRISYL